MEERDLIVIGGGPAGYVAAIRARQLHARVTLIEKDIVGGTCLNYGCIPTRALVRAVELLDIPKKARDYGITYAPPEIDFTKMISRKDNIVKLVTGGVQLLLRENGVEVIKGEAVFSAPKRMAVKTDNGFQELTAGRIIIATGAKPIKPSVPGAERIITTSDALAMKEVPKSLVVLGAGSIGITFAVIFARLGSQVTVLGNSVLLPGFDREIVGLIEKELRKEKIRIILDTTLEKVLPDTVMVRVKEVEETVPAVSVLVADAREAAINSLGLDKTGIVIENGKIKVDTHLETNIQGIYAAGDVTGHPMLANAAFVGGRISVENALGKASSLDFSTIPQCVYTFPEIAYFGMTEEDARAQGKSITVGRFPFSANGLATIMGERSGTVKVISDTKCGKILGVHIMGLHASELIGEAVLASRLEETASVIGGTSHLHPTLSEAIMEAALDVDGETIHFFTKNQK